MRIFVTGGTGFIGTHFLRAALNEGHEVIALRRRGSSVSGIESTHLNWIEGQLNNISIEILKTCDSLVHFAAAGVSPQPTDWETAFKINVQDSLHLCLRAEDAGVGHIVACGSCFEYGLSGLCYPEIPIDAPLEPIGPYASSKAAFSVAFKGLARSSKKSFSLVRLFHLFGEGQDGGNFWPSLKKAAESGEDFEMTAGTQIRDFMPVREAALEFLKCLSSPPLPGNARVTHIGSGKPISLAEFASYWWHQWEASGKLKIGALPQRNDEVMRFVPKLTQLDENS
ncbi:NAD-dependent epimerase/dehydratase family protein [Akkermansiaceae bacterium]|nr:NAD-dependent epimerase/dehydratase family protein [Akkermansiaceae bacterium]